MARRKRGFGGGNKLKARKAVTVKLLEREHAGKLTTPYRIMDELIREHHHHLIDAKIAIAWRFGKKPDADGRLWMGAAKKGSDLDRALSQWDFIITLNHEIWNAAQFTEVQMQALMDHQLCRCMLAKDSSGEIKTDEEGRNCYRLRRPDIVEFLEVYRRHGPWTAELASLAAQRIEEHDRPLLHPKAAEEKKAAAQKSWRDVSLEELEFSGAIHQALADAGLTTRGAIADWSNSHNGLNDIPGIASGRASSIAERLLAWDRNHPEYYDRPEVQSVLPMAAAANA